MVDLKENLKKRPPIVVIMGHVDHGKTTLLDYIRKSKVADREAGGITQSIGAYEIEMENNKITFIDTPGHEVFSQMRVFGSRAADVAVLVVAADEGVKPQTKEAYQIIQQEKIPFVVAISKIDKAGADVNRIKSELAQGGVLLEGFGGNVSWQGISSKTGEGVDELLELIVLTADLEEFTYHPSAVARGFILEAWRDSRRGVVASVIIKDGTLAVGDQINANGVGAKIKSLENFQGKRIKSAQPSAPVLILGFNELPVIGSDFAVGAVTVKKDAIIIDEKNDLVVAENGGVSQVVNVIIKANDSGSLEALKTVLKNLPLPERFYFKIISDNVGEITDSDLKLAISSKSVIVGFNVKINKVADNFLKAQSPLDRQKIKIFTSGIVYKLAEELEEWVKNLGKEQARGVMEILAVFGKKAGKQIIGGRVIDGEIVNNSRVVIKRGGKKIGSGKIVNLQSDKKDTNLVKVGQEGGLLIQTDLDIKVGDELIITLN